MSSTNRGGNRIEKDAYQTPPWCVDLIMPHIKWDLVHNSLEPCKGKGHIYDRIPLPKMLGDSSEYCEISERLDYLSEQRCLIKQYSYDLIVTNPPYSLTMEFLERSLWEAKTVIYLLPLNIYGSKQRKKFWQTNPPTHQFVLSKRPSFCKVCKSCKSKYDTDYQGVCESCGGKVSSGTDSDNYGWIVWDRGDLIIEEPGFYWL